MPHLIHLAILCLLAAPLAIAASVHPFHASLAEAEWNAKTKKLEIAMWAHPIDLEKALQQRTKEIIDLDKTPNLDKHIASYLNDVFMVHDADGKKRKLEWVGKEVTLKSAWLYFEVPLENGLNKTRFSNRLFFELLDDQVNTVNFRQRRDRKRTSLTFTRNNPAKTFSWQAAPPTKRR